MRGLELIMISGPMRGLKKPVSNGEDKQTNIRTLQLYV